MPESIPSSSPGSAMAQLVIPKVGCCRPQSEITSRRGAVAGISRYSESPRRMRALRLHHCMV